ncbi:glutaminase A [Agromyces sp. LHK192]|uniref:glutaminase A n=1 Tax=Agromyces sp. LHK192 TaxID=2498704 RepID=UPI000FD6F390|nr:glutaminase A [Agromyces sp. LHK192]
MELGVGDVSQRAATGSLPGWDDVESLVVEAWQRNRGVDDGTVADYIPILAEADPTAFGIAVVEVDGDTHDVGDVDVAFSIQSISKAFVYALVCAEIGHEAVLERVGVDNTGLPFNSVMAVELAAGHPRNPMVNAGALATTALIPGDPADQWRFIVDGLSRFAGRALELDDVVYGSEAATNQRNRAIARLLESYGRIDRDPLEVVDVYTRQCALRVTAHDLAVMAATLADGGVNPITREQVVPATVCRDTLAVLAASGLYEHSGEWLFEIGLPGKSGVAGGVIAVVPGKAGIGTYSPPLDRAGNSVRGQRAVAFLSRALGLNLFASDAARAADTPHTSPGHTEGTPA